MESTLLKAPRPGGRSRFSKALPAPPPLEFDDVVISTSPLMFPPTSSTYNLSSARPPPIPPTRKALPGMPGVVSPTSSTSSRPLDSPLPPLPLSKVAPAPAPAPAMPIKRRPVGGSLKSPDSIVTPMVSQPVVPPPEPSPTDSLSSLFSAYSRSSGESLVRSSQGTANTKISYTAWSPEKGMAVKETSRTGKGEDVAQGGTAPSNSLSGDTQSRNWPCLGSESPVLPSRPPPSMKDDLRPTTPVTVRSLASAPTSQPPKMLPATPPQPQLWRRRSQKAVADLNFYGSATNDHSEATGNATLKHERIEAAPVSTISLQQPKPAFASSQLPTPTGASPFPRSAGLPGKSIRPTQQPQQQQQQQPLSTLNLNSPLPPATMGNEKSKIASMKEKWEQRGKETTQSKDNSTPPSDSASKRLSPIKRLPTPDYGPEDVQHQLVETIVSPASPATSPEMPALDQGSRLPIVRRPVGSGQSTPASSSALSSPGPSISIGNISPLPSAGPRGRMNPFPVGPVNAPGAQTPTVIGQLEAEPPSSATALPLITTSTSAVQTSTSAVQTPARNVPTPSLDTSAVAAPALSLTPVAPGSATHEVSPLVESPVQPQTVYVPAGGDDVSGDGQMSPVSAAAAFFPRLLNEIRPAGYVFPAKPLSNGHYNCFIGHKTLHANKNDHCPLRCQTCGSDDKYLRWTCSMCNLRVCRGCKEYLLKNGRDLHRLVEHIQNRNLSEAEMAEMAATDAAVDDSFKRAEERRRQQAEEREQMTRQRRQQQQQLLRPPRPPSSGSQGSASSATSGYFPVPPPGAPGGGYGTPRPNTPTQERAAPRP